ncbi:hypothetical protein ES703_23495 [subsurface metagenome]
MKEFSNQKLGGDKAGNRNLDRAQVGLEQIARQVEKSSR